MAAADAAKDAAKSTIGKAGGALKWSFNQLHPFGANGRLGRTVMLMGTTALAGTALASGLPAAGALGMEFATKAGEGLLTLGQYAIGIGTGADWTAAQQSAAALGNALTTGMQ